MLRALTAVLCAVGVLALVFTAVNVTGFATSRGIPLPIAILLDPMISLALAGTLYADARLAGWGLAPPAWSTTMRWGAGLCAALMNTWASLWPDGRIGLPRQADPAAVLLHLTPPLLLIALAETIAAYRRLLTEVHHRTPPAPASAPAPHHRTLAHPSTLPHEATATAAPPATATHAADGTDWEEAHPDPTSSRPRSRHVRPSDTDLFARALALDTAWRARTGQPISIRQLRRQLHLGQQRARTLRTRLNNAHPTGALAPDTAPQHLFDQERCGA
ncbi:hypothetical protein DMB38_26115 [Streptomyces sp. WAC 06738]|uniref:hypothetical protein n=1 Tax=Streptomyces sp. WAC 06738 TaxID=2203210 RepID=UPI000F70D955|nr:hypothetical protein [Streptomyces sp. WAC 06738]AZM48789.1 hypothetical protein DMB38_26115 [Streptomyces sp. WAC 06738]